MFNSEINKIHSARVNKEKSLTNINDQIKKFIRLRKTYFVGNYRSRYKNKKKDLFQS